MTFTYSAELKFNYWDYWDRAAYPSPNKTLPTNIPGCFAQLQPLIRHGLILERRCYRELGGHPSSHTDATRCWLFAYCVLTSGMPTAHTLLSLNEPKREQQMGK